MDKIQYVADLVAILTEERAGLADELHDGVIQYIVGARMWLSSVGSVTAPVATEARAALEVVHESLDQAAHEARNAMSELSLCRDAAAQHELFVERIVDYWRRRGLRIDCHLPGEWQIEKTPAAIMALLLAWLFKYAAEDAHARKVDLQVISGSSLTLEFQHDRPAQVTAQWTEGAGRLGFVKRLVGWLEGQCELDSRPTAAIVTLSLPVSGPQQET